MRRKMRPLFLVQLTENDWRVIIAFIIIVFLVFVLVGFIGALVGKTMEWQGKKCDTLVSDVVTNHIVTKPHQLRVYARKKNTRYFIKQAWVPLLIVLVGVGVLIARNIITKDWTYNPFNKDDGFGTLLFLWDFGNASAYTKVFGITILADWPPLMNEPHYVQEAMYAYISLPCIFIGGIWYLVTAQAYLARTMRSYKLSRQVFEKPLDGFNQNTPTPNAINNNVNNNINNNNIQ